MLDYIKQSFPQGYDLGAYFSHLLEEKCGKRIMDDEVAFIAIYFYNSLIEQNKKTGTKKIAVISSLKNSSTILFRQTLLNWFPNDILKLDFINPGDVSEDILEDYDIYLTTEKGRYLDMGIAMLINPFPNNQDYLNIKLAIDGFKNMEDITQIFGKELFTAFTSADKAEVLTSLCEKVEMKYHLNTLYDEILQRENIGSTFFSKAIAVPHPMHAVSADTFVAVGISKEPITWDEDKNSINLILLVCIGKNNPQAFQLWNYIARMLSDKHFIEKVMEQPTYDNFISIIEKSFYLWVKNSDVN